MSKSTKLRKWIQLYSNSGYEVINNGLYCNACQKIVPCVKVSQLRQHDATSKHKQNFEFFEKKPSKQQFLFSPEPIDRFAVDLCGALIGANIPLFKINNLSFKSFLEENIRRKIPCYDTLRRNVKHIYNEVMLKAKLEIGNNFVWISIDETTDMVGRYVANLLVGVLNERQFVRPHLIAVKFLSQTNSETVSRFVNKELINFGIENTQVLLLVTDAAPYMLKAGKQLAIFYPNLIHVTCVCHALNRICEEIRFLFPLIDQLISSVKKIFTKAPSRILKYKEMCDLPLPPTPILTRWGTWIISALFLSQNFTILNSIIQSFDPNDSISIKKSQDLFSNSVIKQQLSYIQSNYSQLPTEITKLEYQGLTLCKSLDIFNNSIKNINIVEGNIGEQVNHKLSSVLHKNVGLKILNEIASVHRGTFLNLTLEPNIIAVMKFAPISSCDVERSFSLYKNILTDNRTNFTESNLEMYVISNYEKKE